MLPKRVLCRVWKRSGDLHWHSLSVIRLSKAVLTLTVDVTLPKSSWIFFLPDKKCNGNKKDSVFSAQIVWSMERCLGSPVYHLQRTERPPTSHTSLFRECRYRNFWLCFDEGHRIMTCKSETMYLSFTVLILLIKNSILIYF